MRFPSVLYELKDARALKLVDELRKSEDKFYVLFSREDPTRIPKYELEKMVKELRRVEDFVSRFWSRPHLGGYIRELSDPAHS
jgi:hypothetical protein